MTNAAGTAVTGTPHDVIGIGAISTAVTLTNSAVFTSATSYVCYATDTSAAIGVTFTYASGTSFTPHNADTGDVVQYVCIGS
jgi:hypothetical protein